MANDFGVTFAPTDAAADEARRRGQIDGVPEAIRVLSLRMPRVLGANAPVAPELFTAPGAQGVDPYVSAVMQSLVRTLVPNQEEMGQPGSSGTPQSGGPTLPTGRPPKPNIDVIQPPTLPASPPNPNFDVSNPQNDNQPVRQGIRRPWGL